MAGTAPLDRELDFSPRPGRPRRRHGKESRRDGGRVRPALRGGALGAGAPGRARARRGGGQPVARAPRDEGQARRLHVDERPLRGGHRARSSPTPSSWSTCRRRIRSQAPPTRSSSATRRRAPDLELYDPAGGAARRRAGDRHRAKEAEAAARAYDARITNSDGGTFGRTAGGSALVLSSGFRAANRGSYQSLSVVPVADGRGREEAPRLPLDGEALPRRARGRRRGRAARPRGGRCASSAPSSVADGRGPRRVRPGRRALDPRPPRRAAPWGAPIWRKSSYLVGREGTRVASDLVTIVDDPLLRRAPGSRPFDGEGLASRKNVVVEKGILRTYPLRLRTRRGSSSRESTASASRGGGAGVGREHVELHPAAGHGLERSHREGDQARPLRHRDDGLRLQRGHGRLLARRERASGSRTASSPSP